MMTKPYSPELKGVEGCKTCKYYLNLAKKHRAEGRKEVHVWIEDGRTKHINGEGFTN